ncbi:hypothetical protein [Roseomonas elaeocarpi]|uniref:Antitoxin n=1 Tax=Roseomonas elaeocarpi TaxID=907779 RepID=A0ABV6JX70_9PROT
MKQPDKPIEGDKKDWDHVAKKSDQDWHTPPTGSQGDVPEETMDRMREGYGIGKDGADPANDKAGRHPDKPAG